MFIKIVIITVMLLILSSLVSGLLFLIRDHGQSNRTVKALTFRIVLSILLFLFLLLGFSMGWLSPH